MNPFEQGLLEAVDLPRPPPIAERIIELDDRERHDPDALVRLIESDPELCRQLPELIRSLLGDERRIGSLHEAGAYLGASRLRSLALSIPLFAGLRAGAAKGPRPTQLWRSSLASAVAASRLASETGGWESEEAFLAGLLADCGSLVMHEVVETYPGLAQRFRAGEADLLDLERGALETDHMRVGALLLERWGLPARLCRLVAAHHDPSQLESGSPGELRARILNAAWLCARALTVPAFHAEAATLDQHVSVLVGLTPTLVRAIAAELPDELRELGLTFGVPPHGQPSFKQILARAAEVRSQLAIYTESLPAQVQADGARQFADLDLDWEGEGLPSRVEFERMLELVHGRARQTQSSYAVMMIDLSDLKRDPSFWDEAVVEEALAEVYRRATHHLRSGDRAARFAEDQLAILLPGCPPEALQRAATRTRESIEATPIATAAGPLQCRVGIGLAASAPGRDGLDPRTLLRRFPRRCAPLARRANAAYPRGIRSERNAASGDAAARKMTVNFWNGTLAPRHSLPSAHAEGRAASGRVARIPGAARGSRRRDRPGAVSRPGSARRGEAGPRPCDRGGPGHRGGGPAPRARATPRSRRLRRGAGRDGGAG
jgi:diguanylate cyclase (GGDEF)-like protein